MRCDIIIVGSDSMMNNLSEKSLKKFKESLILSIKEYNDKNEIGLLDDDINAIVVLACHAIKNTSGGFRMSLSSLIEEQMNVPKTTAVEHLEEFLDGYTSLQDLAIDIANAKVIKGIINKSPILKRIYKENDTIFNKTDEIVPAINLFFSYEGSLSATNTNSERIFDCDSKIGIYSASIDEIKGMTFESTKEARERFNNQSSMHN